MLRDPVTRLRGIHGLMGRLHNRKTFCRPRNTPCVGG